MNLSQNKNYVLYYQIITSYRSVTIPAKKFLKKS
nr:MAG TPA: hypothetical protein [Bacteriophage sp.]